MAATRSRCNQVPPEYMTNCWVNYHDLSGYLTLLYQLHLLCNIKRQRVALEWLYSADFGINYRARSRLS
jgi:hypothetical protein